jgi:hypothetical protein
MTTHASQTVATLLASGEHSAPVTQIGFRVLLTLLLLGLFAGACWIMLRGYRRRAGRQGDVPVPASAPPTEVDPDEGIEGVYGSTTTHGDWLDRIAVHGLGVRSNAWAAVTGEGVFFAREAAPDLFIPAADLVGTELAPGIAGKVTGGTGVVLVTWRLGERTLDTGFHPRAKADRERLLEAVANLINSNTAHAENAQGAAA